jgi:hypothetical protein
MQEFSLLTARPNDLTVKLVPAPTGGFLTRHSLRFFCSCASRVLAAAILSALANAQDLDTGVTGCPTATGSSVCYTTFQGGVSRRSFNPNEPALTQDAVTSTKDKGFHKQYSTQLNGALYAQPLVLPNVVMNGTTYPNVAYVVTQQDAVYAVSGSSGKILWRDNLVPAGYAYLNGSVDLLNCTDILPTPGDIGIMGTPVIDVSQNTGTDNTITSGTLYLVARTKTKASPVTYVQTLYAISVIDGSVKASIVIGGTYLNGTVSITWDSSYALNENQRGALVALPVSGQNPQILITWAAHCDSANFPYNGWMMAYQLNSGLTALTQTAIWTSVPSDTAYEGGIWQGSSGPALDSSGHIYLSIGNGDANVKTSTPPNDAPTSCNLTPCDYGNSILRMQLSGTPAKFSVQDFFTVFDWKSRNNFDYDLGSGGVMLLPYQSNGNPKNLLAQAGKEGSIYLLQADKGYMGGYNGGNADKVTQYIKSVLCYQTTPVVECGIWGAPAWWTTGNGGGGSSGYAYWGPKSLPLMQFKFYPNGSSCTGTSGAGFCTTPSAQSAHIFSWPGPTPTVSAPSIASAKAIVWLIDSHNATSSTPGPANLWAFDAATLTCLFTTDGQGAPCTRLSTADQPVGAAIKFTVPTVANGQVFVGTTGGPSQGYINIYGID